MKEINLTGQLRSDLGKKASKSLRKEGLIPCNMYGIATTDGKPSAFSFTVPMTELRKLIYTPHIYLVNLTVDGKLHTAILKEIQFHPVTDAVLHVDFLEVNEEKPITIGLPVKLVGLAQGIRDGGRMSLSLRKLNVKAPYKSLPEHLDVDVTALTIGKSIKVGQLSYEGLELVTGKDVVVCSIKMTRAASMAAQAAKEGK
ncbi:50S ribosomal protein L25/general stress protein Ctc [Hoylesella nanceiensis]|jgi:ribosomal protein L25, ctc-form|uniref:Large ribosomal subunit protein bL25 n=1 Tax=Hoylesella nanceiensis TaxID=425941 RepID=A0ABS6YCZ0_9BACT|nr:50S ribosomal protein L25/general stress protein Ctc [Hoylesella nanceiensis]RKW57202.1 MAG: 50S ribosomal protein L25/general stress protein Ctc [Prevotella sp.]MBF1433684.1 50S ribosomal protein L25/general stress protein Ctc [Hoylesella nanceiensis]MBF1440606.1 50S ribosomal protein L25/general stress protein Ctc [Hoylesella nanceiensis]MBW4767626.1 50S ribosomal protein L25/general stress protein Ctc [Hoylesella nanceiensis]MBW4769431.1 50S ribosomal protein L25/general stress protein C